jgi:hypothetical protein
MKNNIKLPEGIDSGAFLKAIQSHLSDNLNKYLMGSLANMLAIDYANRLKEKVDLDEHIDLCIERLTHHLRHKIVLEEDFSTVMSLFAIAITEKKMEDDEKMNSKEQDQDMLVDGIISAHFGDLSPEEQKKVREILKTLIASPDAKEIMNFISLDPKLFYSVVFVAYKEQTKQKEREETVMIHINKIMNEKKSINKSINNFKSLAGKIILSVGLVGAASIGAMIGGFALPALLIPMAAISIRLAPAIGDKIGKGLWQNSNNIKQKENNLKDMVESILQTKIKTPPPRQKR